MSQDEAAGSNAAVVAVPRPIRPPYVVDLAFLQEVFGCDCFKIYRDDDATFHKFSVSTWPTAGILNFFHGMTLGELHSLLLTRNWTAGRYTPPSKSSPLAIWGCTTVGAALDRAAVSRGWSYTQKELPTAWDCPVVLGMMVLDDPRFGKHKTLKTGSDCMRRLVDDPNVPFDYLNVVTVYVPRAMSTRFNRLRKVWHLFKSGEAVLCRTRRCHVEDFWRSGHDNPWSCGRWVLWNNIDESQWMYAEKGSEQWRCPDCDYFKHRRNISVVGMI